MFKICLSSICLFIICQSVYGKSEVFNEKGIAIKGYDPVSYFLEGAPMVGDEKYSYEFKGVVWYFSSGKNRDLFIKNSDRYLPQYGGYCAYGVSKGGTAKVDPTEWKIVDGKLYLNYNSKINSRWEKKLKEYIQKGDENWVELLKDLE